MDAVEQLSSNSVDVATACAALGVPRSSFYRRRRTAQPEGPPAPRPTPERALSELQRQEVLETLHSEEFCDSSPVAVWATLLGRGEYQCSTRTMYRILAGEGEVQERRRQRIHPVYVKPELLATGPNQVWSWDITKLRSHRKWEYFYLYTVLDIYSRYVPGWMVATRENGGLADRLLRETLEKQGIVPGQLIVHQDRGAPMTSKTVAQLYADLGVDPSFSRPHVSDDNPFSEAQFKTLKYRPDFPGKFGSQEDAVSFCRRFYRWYNTEHAHSGIAYMTPASVHYGQAVAVTAERQAALDAAFHAHPERFVGGPPRAPKLPAAVWINPPAKPLTTLVVNEAPTVLDEAPTVVEEEPRTGEPGAATAADSTIQPRSNSAPAEETTQADQSRSSPAAALPSLRVRSTPSSTRDRLSTRKKAEAAGASPRAAHPPDSRATLSAPIGCPAAEPPVEQERPQRPPTTSGTASQARNARRSRGHFSASPAAPAAGEAHPGAPSAGADPPGTTKRRPPALAREPAL